MSRDNHLHCNYCGSELSHIHSSPRLRPILDWWDGVEQDESLKIAEKSCVTVGIPRFVMLALKEAVGVIQHGENNGQAKRWLEKWGIS